jgi:hypothetical protein
VEKIEEAVYGETGTGQQCKRKGELADDKGLAKAMAARSDAGPIAFLERSPGSTREAYQAGALPKRRPARVVAARVKSRIGRLRWRSASSGNVPRGMMAMRARSMA